MRQDEQTRVFAVLLNKDEIELLKAAVPADQGDLAAKMARASDVATQWHAAKAPRK